MAGTSEGQKKGAITRKKKDVNAFKKLGARGGLAKKRGYLGKLKDEGRVEELRAVSAKGAAATNLAKAERKRQTERNKSGS